MKQEIENEATESPSSHIKVENYELFAKKSCRHCYGRGIVEVTFPQIPGQTFKRYCSCAMKGYKKWKEKVVKSND